MLKMPWRLSSLLLLPSSPTKSISSRPILPTLPTFYPQKEIPTAFSSAVAVLFEAPPVTVAVSFFAAKFAAFSAALAAFLAFSSQCAFIPYCRLRRDDSQPFLQQSMCCLQSKYRSSFPFSLPRVGDCGPAGVEDQGLRC